MKKTKADLYREWARVLDMCEGTEVDPNTCCSYHGDRGSGSCMFLDDPENYEFAVAILEGKPVFVGDKLYHIDGNGSYFTVDRTTVRFNGLTWNPPNRTFMLNGVKLPCPIRGSVGVHLGFSGKDYFFASVDDRNKVSQAIIKILDEAKV